MRTARRSKQQLEITSKSRAAVFEFMKRFSARHYWTIDGPMDTDVDEMMCFCMFDKAGNNLGVCIVQTWCSGGWSIYTAPTDDGRLDETEAGIYRSRASKPLLESLQGCLEEISSELEQRKTGGNGEEYEELEKLFMAGENAISLARGISNGT
jgi:hypothetical protein